MAPPLISPVKGIVNPIAMILSARMMLDYLNMSESSRLVENAVSAVLAEGKALPRDLGGSASTTQVTSAILDKLRQ